MTQSYITEYHHLLILLISSVILMLSRLGSASGLWNSTHPSVMILWVTLKHKPVEASYTIHGQTLELVDSSKYLSVTTDSKLNFNNHIDSVAKKANGTQAFLNGNLKPAVTASETQPTKRTSD